MNNKRIDAFIFNWRGHHANARVLEREIGKLTRVQVINSDEEVRDLYPHWVHLDESAYCAAQWNKAKQLFDGDILFHIQADAYFNQFKDLFASAVDLFEAWPVGIYEPNVDYTLITFDTSKLEAVCNDLYRVPCTDNTCWFIAGSVVREFSEIDTSLNKIGWGIPGVAAAISYLKGLICLRDYNFLVKHPKFTGYSIEEANQERLQYLATLPEIVRRRVEEQAMQRQILIGTVA